MYDVCYALFWVFDISSILIFSFLIDNSAARYCNNPMSSQFYFTETKSSSSSQIIFDLHASSEDSEVVGSNPARLYILYYFTAIDDSLVGKAHCITTMFTE